MYVLDGVYVEENERFGLAEAHTTSKTPKAIERTAEVKHLASNRGESDTREESTQDGSVTEESTTEETPGESSQDRPGETVTDNEVSELQPQDADEQEELREGSEKEDVPAQDDDAS